MVKDKTLLDEDVLWLFDDGYATMMMTWLGYTTGSSRPGSMAAFVFGPYAHSFHIAKLHPSEWFHAFSEERFRDHLPSA